MKKLVGLLAILMMFCCLPLGGNIFCARATESNEKTYLIAPDYKNDAANYGILNDEIKHDCTPLDYSSKQMMAGQSIAPAVNSSEYNTFEKTFLINEFNIAYTQSIYVYMFFSETYAHNLSISVFDETGSLTWNISDITLMQEIFQDTNSSDLRFGWMLLELPVAAAQEQGDISVAKQMTIKYSSPNANDKNNYAHVLLYAPYVALSQKEEINFSQKQKFYNFKINWQAVLETYCVGDEFAINNWSNIFEYCIVGEVDYLKHHLNVYKFELDIIDENYNTATAVIFADEFSYKFEKEGSYTFRVTLYDSENNWLCKALDKVVSVSEFVPIYISKGLPKLKEGASAQFTIEKSSLLIDYNGLLATSSDENIAQVYIDGDKLCVNAKSAGTVTITLSINGLRAGGAEQVYTNSYVLKVQKNSTNSWITLIFSGIGLLIAGIIVYIIMVKKRLIPGKYPKY